MESLPQPKVIVLATLAFLFAGCVTPLKTVKTQPATASPALKASTANKSSIWPVSFQEITEEVTSAVMPSEAPAAEIVCMWQNRVSYLPDPSKNGAMSPGLAGQMFLFDSFSKNAKANGQLTVDLYDESKVHSGVAPVLIERWIFDKDTLKKLASFDETFGRSYTLFLPWPTYKPEFTQVRVMVKLEPTQGHALFAPAAPLTLDASSAGLPVWSGGSTNGPRSLPGGMQSDPVSRTAPTR